MTSYPPSRPVSRPGQPVATRNPGPQGAPAVAQQAAPVVPTSGEPKAQMSTSTVLAWWRVFVVIVCLVAAVVGPLVLNENRNSLIRVNDSAQQVLRLEAVRGDVLAADAAANNALVDAVEGQPLDQGHIALLSHASAVLVEASAAQPADAEVLATVNAALTEYAVQVSNGLAARDSDELARASATLDETVLSPLNEQIALNQQRLEFSIGDQRWLSILMALPIVVLLGASVVLAQRTRRVINIGLVVALGIAIAVFAVTTQMVTTSARSVGAVQSGPVVQATAASGAYAAITEAKAWESRVLLGIVPAAQGEEAFAKATDQARAMLELLPAASTAGMLDRLTDFQSAHADLIAAGSNPPARAVARTASDQAYNELTGWLPEQANSIGRDLDAQLTAHAETVRNATGGIAAGLVLAAFAAGVGVSQPLRRYR